MKLQAYLEDTTKAILANKKSIVNHAYYLQCLVKLGAEHAPKNFMVRLAWDIIRLKELREIKNKVYDEGANGSHIETLMSKAIKQSSVLDGLKDLSDETKEMLMEDARITAIQQKQRKDEGIQRKAEQQAMEQEKADRELKEEVARRTVARALYNGYCADMTDKQFDKFHDALNEKTRYDGLLMTQRKWIELIINSGGYPVLIAKGEKGNKKPFDVYDLQLLKKIKDGIHLIHYSINKAFYLYAAYLHGEKVYTVDVKRAETVMQAQYTAKNPIEAIKQHCKIIGVNYESLISFSYKDGIKKGEWVVGGYVLSVKLINE
jgi:hypothetical protein